MTTNKFFGAWFDESERGDMLVVGGFFAPLTDIDSMVKDWRQMKESLGLCPWAEVKWKLSQHHNARKELEKAGHTTRELAENALNIITKWPHVTVLVGVMIDVRREWWRQILGKTSSRDFYCEGLRYLLQRLGEESIEMQWNGCLVVCDTPSLGKEKKCLGAIRRSATAHYEIYKRCYELGSGVGPGRNHPNSPFSHLPFYPSLLVGDATFDDMLQVADVIVGAVADWVASVRKGKGDDWLVECIEKLVPLFRSRHGKPDFWGDGFFLWPKKAKAEVWFKLKSSLTK